MIRLISGGGAVMAKKKASAGGDKPAKKKSAKKKSAKKSARTRTHPADIPMMQDLMRMILGGQIPLTEGDGEAEDDDSPAGRADALVRRAHQSGDSKKAIALAKEALAIDPDCVDAHLLLGDQSRTPQEALAHYVAATSAAQKVLGPEVFEQGVGDFWLIFETRPYMRARLGLAECLWVLGRRDEAVEHYKEMLRLNPGDNQGIRYLLATALLELGRDQDMDDLLHAYEDEGSASWAFSRALLAFRRDGDSPEARKALAEAKKVNKHVLPYLSGEKLIPTSLPATVGMGDASEAVDYAAGNLRAWRATQGAIPWLRSIEPPPAPKKAAKAKAAKKKAAKARAPKASGPLPLVKERLKRIETFEDETWQADVRPLEIPLTDNSDPHVLMIVSKTEGLLLAQDIFEGPPPPDILWDRLARAIEQPMMSEPLRPADLQVRPGLGWEELADHIEEIEVKLVVVDRLDLIDKILEEMVASFSGDGPIPGFLDLPGVGRAEAASFFQAAAEFYRKAPWRSFAGEETIEVTCDRLIEGPRYAVVMGQMGMTRGVALYEDLEFLVEMREGDMSDEEIAHETVALSVTYDWEAEANPTDVEHAKQYGWEVAAPDGYPSVMAKELGPTVRPPSASELTFLEACLRAIPQFLDQNAERRPTAAILNVPTADGGATLSLRWVGPGEGE